MRLKFLKEIEIHSCKFKLIWDKSHNGGSFSCGASVIVVGIKDYKTDPTYTLQILSHEIMELILVFMGARYDHPRLDNNYLFNFNHQTLENAIQMHTQILTKFLA